MDGEEQGVTRLPRLSREDSVLLVQHVVVFGHAQLPLEQALRMTASEYAGRPLAVVLSSMATQLERGHSLSQALLSHRTCLSGPVAHLIPSVERDSEFLPALVELLEQQRSARADRRWAREALAYPLVVLVLTCGIALFLAAIVLPPLDRLLRDFEMTVPLNTQILAWFLSQGVFWLAAASAAMALLVFGGAIIAGPARRQRWLHRVPLIGKIWWWSAVVAWCRQLRPLIRRGIPLPDALRLTGQGLRAGSIKAATVALADGVTQGRSMTELVSSDTRWPPLLQPVLQWGERSGNLHAAMDIAQEMLEKQLQLRAMLLRTILPPLVFLLIGAMMLSLIGAAFGPIMILLGSYSVPSSLPGLTARDDTSANLAVGIFLGAALWIAVRLSHRGHVYRDALRRNLSLAAVIMMLLGMIGISIGLMGPLALIFWMVAATVMLMAAGQLIRAEQRSLLAVLATAAQQQIPLADAAAAFAGERRGEMATRSSVLADLLQAGVPLSTAMERSRSVSSADAVLAARVAEDSGDLVTPLRQLVRHEDELDQTRRVVLERFLYLMLVLLVTATSLTLIMWRVVPLMESMFGDLQAAGVNAVLPASTEVLIALSDQFDTFGFLLYVLLVPPLLLGLMAYLGWWPRRLVLFSSLIRRADGAVIMRALSVAVVQRRAMDQAIEALSWQYPRPYVKKKLLRVSGMVRQGVDWADGLSRVRLITPADAAVLQAAQRVGNLAWALEEMASSSLRRMLYRLRAAGQIIFPLALLFAALCTLTLAVAVFRPLVDLILTQI